MRLVRNAPDDDEVNLGLARAATKAKRWNQAVMAYETLLEKHPNEAGLYGELAHVYMLIGDREAAERSTAMMRSLDGKSTKAETDTALDVLESRYSDFQVHGKVRAGLQYDSNANLGPSSNDLDLGIWRLRANNAKARERFGAYLGADLDLGKRLYRDSSWWVVGDVQGFWRGHENPAMSRTHSKEAHWGRAAVGVRHLSSSTLAEVRMKAEVFDYEWYQNVNAYGPEGTFLWAATPAFHLIAKGNLEKRSYVAGNNREAYLRDGTAGSAGLYGRVFFGSDNHEFLVGARYLGANAYKKKDYGYNGWEGTARLLFKLPHGFELAPFVSYTQEAYVGPATALEEDKRWDNRFRIGLGLTYRINESWAIEAGYHYTRNMSNSSLYTYDQHFVNTGIVWSF
jgi:opacity protein-like surface antigen